MGSDLKFPPTVNKRSKFLISLPTLGVVVFVVVVVVFNFSHFNVYLTPCKELTHWKRPWCWEGLGARGEEDDRGWDGRMALPTRWAWVWVNSRSWWWTGRPGVLRFMGLQRTEGVLNGISLRFSLALSWLIMVLAISHGHTSSSFHEIYVQAFW